MGMIAHRDFTSEAEMRAYHVLLRKKFYSPRKPVKVLPPPVVVPPKPVEIHAPPLWKVSPTNFNSHVIDYHMYMLAHEEGREYQPVKLKRTMDDIAGDVLKAFPGISLAMVKGARRSRPVILPRHLIFYEIRENNDKSLPEIGKWCGDRDHTTVMSGIQKIHSMREAGELAWYFDSKERGE